MFGKVVRAIAVGFICLLVSGGSLEIVRLFVGPNFSEHGLSMLVIPMGAISWIASYSKLDINLSREIIIIFIVIWFAIVFANVAPLFLLFLLGGYIAFYAKHFLIGWNYIFVDRLLEREAEKQETRSLKLDADTELADAVRRHARARAALADAEPVLRETQEGSGRTQYLKQERGK